MSLRATRRPAERIDWKSERDRIDLAALATRLLGPAPERRGERGRRLWWSCPLGSHPDQNPSFAIDPGSPWWRCYSCGERGDAATLVMRIQGLSFPEAIATICGGTIPPRSNRPKAPSVATPRPRAGPSGVSPADALAVVDEAEARLWTPAGSAALDYLIGPERCLCRETIRAARLGWTPGVGATTKDGRTYEARGIVIPWFLGSRLVLIKIRRPEGSKPKYSEVFRESSAPSFYCGSGPVRPSRPLVIVEAEFDALTMGEALGEAASVITFGSASARPEGEALAGLLAAPRWFVATDGDAAGDRAAQGWPPRARRVRPPRGFKDWTDAKAAGITSPDGGPTSLSGWGIRPSTPSMSWRVAMGAGIGGFRAGDRRASDRVEGWRGSTRVIPGFMV